MFLFLTFTFLDCRNQDVFEARLAAYLNLCARDDEIPVVAADVETQMETEEVAELPAVNTQAEQIDCDAAELVTASIDVPHAHAEVIQRAWRVRLAHGQAELRRRRLLEQQHEKEEQAARRIQTEIRRHVDRLKAVKVEEQQREKVRVAVVCQVATSVKMLDLAVSLLADHNRP